MSAILESEMPCGFVQTDEYDQLIIELIPTALGARRTANGRDDANCGAPGTGERWGRTHHARRPNMKE